MSELDSAGGFTDDVSAQEEGTAQPAAREAKPVASGEAKPKRSRKKSSLDEGEAPPKVTNAQAEAAMANATFNPGDATVREGMNWFVLRVASNKESSVRDTLLRKVQIEGMGHMVSRILVPTEKTKTIKAGKQKIQETKLYPGYVFVEMRLEDDGRIPQDVFFLIKETTGVGDFVGTKGRPTPMKLHEIEKMLAASLKLEDQPQIKLVFEKGEHVLIKEGPFQGYEGDVDELLPDKGLVRVLVTIFGRQAPVELEEWQIAKADEG